MAKAFPAELIDELLAGAKTKDAIFGPEGVPEQLTGAIVERVLRAEFNAHLEQEREATRAPCHRWPAHRDRSRAQPHDGHAQRTISCAPGCR